MTTPLFWCGHRDYDFKTIKCMLDCDVRATCAERFDLTLVRTCVHAHAHRAHLVAGRLPCRSPCIQQPRPRAGTARYPTRQQPQNTFGVNSISLISFSARALSVPISVCSLALGLAPAHSPCLPPALCLSLALALAPALTPSRSNHLMR